MKEFLQPSQSQYEAHPAETYLHGLRQSGRNNMRDALERIAKDLSGGRCTLQNLPWHLIRFQHVRRLRTLWIDAGLAPATCNVRLSAVRGVLRIACQLDLVSAEDSQRVVAIPNVRNQPILVGRTVSSNEMEALFRTCAQDSGPIGARDAALLAVLYGGALRGAEAVALQRSDWLPGGSKLLVRARADRQREVFLPGGAIAALRAWCRVRDAKSAWLPDACPLFCRVSKGGRIVRHRGMTVPAVSSRLRHRCRQAAIPSATPRDLRRSHIIAALDNGADIAAVAANVGHVSILSTARYRYDRRSAATKHEAARTVPVPYTGFP